MKCLDNSLEYSVLNNENISAYPMIVVAAGNATRMKGIDKILADLDGTPILIRTLTAVCQSNRVCEVVVVTREDKIDEYSALVCNKFLKNITFCVGGASREESVYNGIKALGNRYDKVLVHDCARPLVTADILDRVSDALNINDSVTCGVKVKDTIKSVNEEMCVTKTFKRNFLISIQTPQGVSVKKFCESAKTNDLSSFTDDTSVVEAVGCTTVVVDGDYRNIKITTPEDLKLARLYLEED